MTEAQKTLNYLNTVLAKLAFLQESRIKEAHIVQLMEARQMPYPFQMTVYTANIDSHVSLFDVVLYLFTHKNISDRRCVQGSDVEKQTSVLPDDYLLITRYTRNTIPHDGISNG